MSKDNPRCKHKAAHTPKDDRHTRRLEVLTEALARIGCTRDEIAAEAMGIQRDVMRDPKTKGSDKLAAARDILDRTAGRPAQVIAGDKDNPLQVVTLFDVVKMAASDDSSNAE